MNTTRGHRLIAGIEGGAVPRTPGTAVAAAMTIGRRLVGASLLLVGCGQPKVPAPDAAIDRYISAVRSGDTETVWSMMNSGARQHISKAELTRLLADNHKELIQKASALEGPQRQIEQRAVLFLHGGRETELVLEAGQFHIKYQDLLMGDAGSPHAALEELRWAVGLRDYPRVLSLLSPELKNELEVRVQSLLSTLGDLDGAVLDVQGDTATYTFPGGGVVQLKKVGQVWLITELP